MKVIGGSRRLDCKGPKWQVIRANCRLTASQLILRAAIAKNHERHTSNQGQTHGHNLCLQIPLNSSGTAPTKASPLLSLTACFKLIRLKKTSYKFPKAWMSFEIWHFAFFLYLDVVIKLKEIERKKRDTFLLQPSIRFAKHWTLFTKENASAPQIVIALQCLYWRVKLVY